MQHGDHSPHNITRVFVQLDSEFMLNYYYINLNSNFLLIYASLSVIESLLYLYTL